MFPARRPCGLISIPVTARFSTPCVSGIFRPTGKNTPPCCIRKPPTPGAKLYVQIEGKGGLDLDVISLFPGAHLEGSPRRFARGHGAGACGFASRASCVSPAAASWKGPFWPSVTSGRTPSARWTSARCSSTAGTLNSATARRRIITSRSASASSNISSLCEDIGARAAADSELRHGLPVQFRRALPAR